MENSGKGCQSQHYFTTQQWVVFALVVSLGLILRWVALDVRPIHHDESLHLTYGSYYFRDPLTRFYQYDPKLHGPLLYQWLVVAYQLLGESVWGGRALVAFLGSLCLFAPFVFRRFLSPLTVIGLTTYVSFSPTIVYFSRFLREDFVVFSGLLLTLYGATIAPVRVRALLVLVGISLQFCVKENAYVHLAMIVGFIAFEFAWARLRGKLNYVTLLERIFRYIEHQFGWFLLGVLAAVVIYMSVYSGFGLYVKGILDGFYRLSLAYWWGQHEQERISGPFLFPQYFLAWYEPLFCLAVVWVVGYIFTKGNFGVQVLGSALLVCTLLIWLGLSNDFVVQSAIGKLFKFKDTRDAAGGFLMLGLAPLITTLHLERGERGLAATGYTFFATLFTYSFLGEKVPWLTLYPLVTGLLYLTFVGRDLVTEKFMSVLQQYSLTIFVYLIGLALIVFGIVGLEGMKSVTAGTLPHSSGLHFSWYLIFGVALIIAISFFSAVRPPQHNTGFLPLIVCSLLCFQLYLCLAVNFSRSGEASELISQVHTTKEVDGIAYHILAEARHGHSAQKEIVQVLGEGTWPLVWYFRDAKNYRFSDSTPNFTSTYQYIFANESSELPANVPYTRDLIPLRGWWVPNYKDITPSRFIYYLVTRRPWEGNPVGYQNISLFRRIP